MLDETQKINLETEILKQKTFGCLRINLIHLLQQILLLGKKNDVSRIYP